MHTCIIHIMLLKVVVLARAMVSEHVLLIVWLPFGCLVVHVRLLLLVCVIMRGWLFYVVFPTEFSACDDTSVCVCVCVCVFICYYGLCCYVQQTRL